MNTHSVVHPSSSPRTRKAVFAPLRANAPDHGWAVALLTLQGIVNRKGPRLLFDGRTFTDWEKADVLWREIYTRERSFEFEEIADRDGLLRKFRRNLKGAVLYDPDFDPGRSLAITVAGLEDLLPATEEMLTLIPFALDVKHDFRGRWSSADEAVTWGLANLMPRCSKRYVYNEGESHGDINLGWDKGIIGALDYVIMHQGYVMNFSPADEPGEFYGAKIPGYPEEARLFKKVLSQLEKPAAVYGWAEPEWTFTEKVNQCGHYVMCGHEANLSFHKKVSTRVMRFRQSKPPKVKLEDDKVYIAFFTSEGDTPRMVTSHFYGAWEDPNRGAIPINWGSNPLFPAEFPVLAERYYRTATPNDYFLCGVGGCGYIFPDHMADFETFLEFARPHFARADMPIVDIWQRENTSTDRWPLYAERCGLKAIISLPREGDVGWATEDCPIIYQHKPIHYFKGTPEEIAQRTREVAAELPTPRFLILYNSPPTDAPTYYKSIYEQLDPATFIPVRMDVLVDLIHQDRRRKRQRNRA